ncbi:glutathione S-transferase C-terminal domain-containing protein-like [Mizuhopecten yessoensis]|uniref:Glutathione S-transferase C-terminal domain-containing protein n=1 Tax=Mizuhopecten yessoensis TaxID=6573 RepID=A0A210QE66_MIZYE|nr:glutathione S-transferase C-terminal domain-containing protein-like [Mizuhopecten yessoensis]XP_021360248.1 glutathione S-transferase C-terminal domain-containing protein-like [Mizuhopecten yessoensis]XP_021360250.1 glutathione S-transferase C-terminal domain-containing protein-like [Mizuhopecten yessoensis]XP_021360251.1 glutathione S-transferase C-terminal domain-containing protein-like [Mizuhopecten yessoensis]OWF47057.1 Glutathione S-transferase C-terminal domain-containing protein [Mizu
MASTTVYLAGVKQGDSHLLLPLQSAAILFLSEYCISDTVDFHLTLVDEGIDQSVCVTVNQSILCKYSHTFVNQEEGYRNCALPVIVEEGGKLIRSGLCSIIRQIVIIAQKRSPAEDFEFLLGFRGGSLKACAEVSGWTKLCEVDFPNSVSELIQQIREIKNADREGTEQIEIPENVMKLELHLQTPAKLHTENKHKKCLLSQVIQEAEQIDSISKLSQFKLQHDFPSTHCVTRISLKSNDHIESAEPGSKSNSCENGKSVENQKIENIISSQLKQNNQPNSCNDEKSFQSVEELTSFLKTLTLHDVDLVHLYAEGKSITVADLILFPFVYHLLEVLSFNLQYLNGHVPRVISWVRHMSTLPRIQECARNCGYNMAVLDSSDVTADSGQEELSLCFVTPSPEQEKQEDDLELSRRCRSKSRPIKPEVASALEKVKESDISVELGQHPCGMAVELVWDNIPEGVHPGADLPKKRLMRKCQQLENLVTAVQAMAKPGDIIVDFCSGGGHLGLVIAYLMPDCQIYLVENNESSLMRAKSRVDKARLTNVTLFQCNQDYFRGRFDVGTCLHACGSATDMVLHQCLQNNANFVICPCCYGGIQNTHLMSYPRSQRFKTANIPSKDFIVLGHAADQTEFNRDLEEQGKYCMNLVDTDRASLARESGYTVDLCSLIPPSCTPKNNILIGRPNVCTAVKS